MLQCKDCEFFSRDTATGRIMMRCDPFGTIKEPACIEKWQLARLDALLQSYQAILRWYQKFAPIQEKMFDLVNREMNDVDEADSWKRQQDDEKDDDNQEDSSGNDDWDPDSNT